MMPTRHLLEDRGRLSRALRATVPRPKIAAGLLTYIALQILNQLHVGVDAKSIEFLITFAVMWAWRDPFAVPLQELPLGATKLPSSGQPVTVVFADRTQAAIARNRLEGHGTSRTSDTIAAAAAIDAALKESPDDA